MRQAESYNYEEEWSMESIKVEPQLEKESAFCYHSSPATSFPQSVYNSSVLRPTSHPRRHTSPITAPNRHSHPNELRIDPILGTELDVMSQHYRQYSASPPSAGSSRRSGSGDGNAAAFGYPDSYSQGAMRHAPSNSAMTSSLSGAVGPMATSPSGMAWTPQSSSLSEGYNMDPSAYNPLFGTPPTPLSADSSSSFIPYDTYNASGFPTSPDSQLAPSYNAMSYSTSRPPVVVPSQSTSSLATPMVMSPAPSAGHGRSEIDLLREHVQQLRAENKQLRNELHRARSQASPSHGLPSPAVTPTFQDSTPAFRHSWQARTEARTKIFCSLNRAGNALCAWHDSRRERRQYPPRNAPRGYLNCGCSYEEALFEESLARHGVGSYHPGENVRMDPALRNPLLKLLKERYGYRDGDFERDPVSGLWKDGEGPAKWEAQAQSGVTPKKNRGEGH